MAAENKMTEPQKHIFTKIFEHIDRNQDGYIVFEELKAAILAAVEVHGKQVTEEEAKAAAQRALMDCDENLDQKISLKEWLNFFGKVIHVMDDNSINTVKRTFGFKGA